MADVFISYSSKDSKNANEIYEYLRSCGIDCWISEHNVKGGQNYALEISNAIMDSQIFVLLLSSNSQKSDHVFNELTVAHDNHKRIIPISVDKSALLPQFSYILASTHRYDATQNFRQVIKEIARDIVQETNVEKDNFLDLPNMVVCPKCGSEMIGEYKKLSFFNYFDKKRKKYLFQLSLLWVMIIVSFLCALETTRPVIQTWVEELAFGKMIIFSSVGAIIAMLLANLMTKNMFKEAVELNQQIPMHLDAYQCTRCWHRFNIYRCIDTDVIEE